MQFGRFMMTPSFIALGVGGVAILGVFLWWLVRKRQKRVWLPTIRIMRLEANVLPKLSILTPPWLPFICFVLSALMMMLFSLRPTTQIFTAFEPNQTRIHVFVDMSPSVSAHLSLEEYASKVATLYEGLKDAGRVTMSTSHVPTVFEPKSVEDVLTVMRKQSFHRAGLRLGSAMKILLEDLGPVDRLFIVSDRDQHSWTGFNWSYLQDDMAVNLVDVSRTNDSEKVPNLFIHNAKFLSSPSSSTMEWDVELGRDQSEGPLEGMLSVRYMGRELTQTPWKMTKGKSHQIVRVEWSQTLLDESEDGTSRDIPLVFEVKTEGVKELLTLDDEFRSKVAGVKHDVVVIGETGGEQLLEDPLSQLQVALDVLGFKAKRFDFIKQPGPKVGPQDFMVLAGGTGQGVDRFCPRRFETLRLSPGGQGKDARTMRASRGGKGGPKVWLFPLAIEADYNELCLCYARLLASKSDTLAEPTFCQNVTSRSQWVGLLGSLGAKQVGGAVGEARGALAFHQTDDASGTQVLAFTVPLVPLKSTGISHADLPIIVKDLLSWQGLLESQGQVQRGNWPRIDDIAQDIWAPQASADDATQLLSFKQTNVPMGESFLSEADTAILPPRWTAQMDWNVKQLPAKKDHEDPLPWIKIAGWVLVAVTLVEALFGLGRRLWRIMARRPEVLTLVLGVILYSQNVFARVEFNLVGYRSADFSITNLAREVSQRTSIELTTRPSAFPKVTDQALLDPWLWVRDLSLVTDASGQLLPAVAFWMKRGGFLVIESPTPSPQLSRLTQDVIGRDGKWLPLPPDHELMRSFYLLDALPDCNGEIWRGFSFDGRLAILSVPYGFLETLLDKATPSTCAHPPDQERAARIFVNLTMVALATDYKKDQIHLPEILKRLR